MSPSLDEALAKRAEPPALTPRQQLRSLLDRNIDAIGASLPHGFDSGRFARLLLTAANTSPELFDCDPTSFLAAGVACAQLGLEPNDARGLAYLVPFNDRQRGKVVTVIIGYRGMLDLARRSNRVTAVQCWPVFEGDTFRYQLGLYPSIEHDPNEDAGDDYEHLTHVYATARVDGDVQFVVLTRRQLDRVRDQYNRSKLSPWTTYPVEMAQKTALRRLCKWLPQTVEVAASASIEDRPLSLDELTVPEGHSHDPELDAGDVIETDEAPAEVET